MLFFFEYLNQNIWDFLFAQIAKTDPETLKHEDDQRKLS